MSEITDDINYPKLVWEAQRRFRIARAPLLQQLDIAFMRAQEINDQEQIQAVVNQKNALRDITKYDFSTVTNLDDILEIWPSILGDKLDF
jgi:hypothetical protein